jgi:acyl carrier protein
VTGILIGDFTRRELGGVSLDQKISWEDFRNIVVERLGVEPEQVTMDASFQEDLNADSLDLVELIYAFEENTGLEIPDEDAEKITTVGQAWEYIQEKSGG